MIDKYIKEQLSILMISKLLNISSNTVWRYLNKFNILIRSKTEGLKINWKKKLSVKDILTEQFIKREYIINKKSSYQIAKEVKCNKSTVLRSLTKYKIQKRNISDSTKLNTPRGKRNWMFNRIICGDKAFAYKDGRTPLYILIRNLKENNIWRNSIFKRDKYICQECGKTNCYLESHHSKSFSSIFDDFLNSYSQFSSFEDKETLVRLAISYEPFWDINNGISLCKECHSKKTTRPDIKEKINGK